MKTYSQTILDTISNYELCKKLASENPRYKTEKEKQNAINLFNQEIERIKSTY